MKRTCLSILLLLAVVATSASNCTREEQIRAGTTLAGAGLGAAVAGNPWLGAGIGGGVGYGVGYLLTRP